jgi:hypothetical protein
MSLDRNTELLAAHADTLNQPGTFPSDARANQPADLAALFDVAARTKRALQPVTPTPEFRARLRDGLRMAAYHREMHELLVRQRAETPWGFLVGAAALGSAAGLLAMLLRARQSARTEEQTVAREPTA